MTTTDPRPGVADGDALILLLPPRRRFGAQPISVAVSRALGRADRLPVGEPGEQAQLARHFRPVPDRWPMAALTRQHDLGDAQGAAWLRADPVSLRPDMTGARLVAWSNLGLSSEDADALMQVLRPLFGDSGMQLSAGAAERWYLHVAREAPLPSFAPPGDALGDNLIDHLPPGPEGKRWRALMNEAQILLHNHPVNAQRLAAGLAPANSLWFWGGGVLPDRIATQLHAVDSLDPELRALAAYAGLTLQRAGQGSLLIDKRHCRDWARFEMADLQEALSSMGRRFDRVQLDFGDGASFVLRAVQRWRFWRPALAGLGNDG